MLAVSDFRGRVHISCDNFIPYSLYEPVRPDIFNPNFFQLFNLFFERFWSTFPVLTGETGS